MSYSGILRNGFTFFIHSLIIGLFVCKKFALFMSLTRLFGFRKKTIYLMYRHAFCSHLERSQFTSSAHWHITHCPWRWHSISGIRNQLSTTLFPVFRGHVMKLIITDNLSFTDYYHGNSQWQCFVANQYQECHCTCQWMTNCQWWQVSWNAPLITDWLHQFELDYDMQMSWDCEQLTL